MKTNPEISVIILSLNHASYIQEAIDSVYSQSHDSVELIVVDDGSKDNTVSVLQSNKDRPNFHYYQLNSQGSGHVRNYGLKQASGDFICFLDADDQLLPGSLNARLNVLKNNLDIDLIFTEVLRLDQKDMPGYAFLTHHHFLENFTKAIKEKKEDIIFFHEQYFDCALKHLPFIWTSSVMTRKNVIEKTGAFDEKINGAEDIEYWLRIAQNGQVAYINTPLTAWHHYHCKSSPQSHTQSLQMIACYQKIKNNLGPKQHLAKIIHKRMAYHAFAGGYDALNINDPRQASSFFIKACFYNPFSKKNWLYLSLSLLPTKVFAKLRKIKQQKLLTS